MVTTLRYLGFDQLHRNYGVMADANPLEDLIILVESERMVSARNWHRQRLWFLLASARRFAKSLQAEGFRVKYVKAPTTIAGIARVLEQEKIEKLIALRPNSFRLTASLQKAFGEVIEWRENDFFLTTREDFSTWAQNEKKLVMENFYRKQRVKFNILISDNKPVGGAWNFDKENRLPPPKNPNYAPYLNHPLDEIDESVLKDISDLNLWGEKPTGVWGSSRQAALDTLHNFLANNFEHFGPYEDAMDSRNWAVHHSLLSPYLNNGLLHPGEVIEAVRIKYKTGKIPLASCEGFIRQIIGWREYINGVYWYFGESYRKENHFNHNRKLLPLFHDETKTKMNCVGSTIKDVKARAWVHHIPRLMVLGNLALLSGIDPIQFLNWMREVFIDAADWVMVPNVIGMVLHADGGKFMTKPYIGGGSYISKMSNYCAGCIYDPKARFGENACPFTNLYWNFLADHQQEFSSNHRMFQQLSGLKRLTDLIETLADSPRILAALENGEV